MTKRPILQPNQPYTFSNYFDLPYELAEIVAEFGYTSSAAQVTLPRTHLDIARVATLKSRIERTIPYIGLTSETARREVLIAPVLLEVVDYTHARLSLEYPINVSEQLKGTLDYYLRSDGQILIVEAKKADLEAGFKQLAVELIAVDRWTDSEQEILLGAVSNGSIWQFGKLHRQKKEIVQDLNLYRVPADLEDLLQVIIAAVSAVTN